MATIGRGSSSGKEKKGTSPSSSLLKKASPKPTTSTPASSSSSPAKEKISSPTDGRPVPNYLKPTMSSSLDFSRAPKKSPLDPTPVVRRRSFDRPPPTAQVQKAIRNNGPQPRETKTLRSSSFSHKPTTSSRPASEKIYARTTSAINKDPIMSKSRSLNRKSTLSPSVTPVIKKKAPSSSIKKGPKSVTSETSSIDQDNQSMDQLGIEDDLVSLDNEVQSLPEISEMPDCNEELGDPIGDPIGDSTVTDTDLEVKEIEDVQENLAVITPVKAVEQENVYEEKSVDALNETITESGTVEVDQNDQAVIETVKNESDAVEHKVEEKDEIQILEIQPEAEIVEESVDDEKKPAEEQKMPAEEVKVSTEEPKVTANAEEGVKEEQTVKLVEEKKDEGAQKLEAEKVEEVQKAKEEKQTVSPPAKDKEEKQTVSPPAKEKEEKQTVSTPAKAGQMGSGKKDKQDYNNIIEQTSTKLMSSGTSGRRNKVLALAGAFETVISLDKK